jgi:hypothetical protein
VATLVDMNMFDWFWRSCSSCWIVSADALSDKVSASFSAVWNGGTSGRAFKNQKVKPSVLVGWDPRQQ